MQNIIDAYHLHRIEFNVDWTVIFHFLFSRTHSSLVIRHATLERDSAVRAGVALRAFGITGHTVRKMVSSYQHAQSRRRAERGRVHIIIVKKTVLRELI